MNKMNKFRKYSMIPMLAAAVLLTGCEKEEEEVPEEEHDHEVFTDVKLIFTNTQDSSDVVEALAQDPDYEGVEELTVLDTINLDKNKALTWNDQEWNENLRNSALKRIKPWMWRRNAASISSKNDLANEIKETYENKK